MSTKSLVLSCSKGLHETLALLTSQLHPDANHKEDLRFLKDVFSERSLGYLMKVGHQTGPHWCQICGNQLLFLSLLLLLLLFVSQIHDKLRHYEKHSPVPVLHSAACLAEDVRTIFPKLHFSRDSVRHLTFTVHSSTAPNEKLAGGGAPERPAGGRWEGAASPAEHSSPQGSNPHCCR